VDGGAADSISICQLPETLPALAIAEDRLAIEIERHAPDVPAFEPRTPEAGAHPLDDQTALEFGHRGNDRHHRPAQRSARVDLLAEADELDVEPAELVDGLEEVPHRPGQPVEGPDQDHVEAAAARLAHHQVQSWTARLRAADGVGVRGNDVEAALRGHGPQVEHLRLGVLIAGADPGVDRTAFHARRPFGRAAACRRM